MLLRKTGRIRGNKVLRPGNHACRLSEGWGGGMLQSDF
jgi:hypothetical protein